MKTPSPLRIILLGGLIIGTLDGLAAMMNAIAHNISVMRLWQYVATGLLGRASFEHGRASMLLGIFLEYVISIGVMAVFFFACRALPILLRFSVATGALYGVAVFFFMSKIVVPLSAVPPPRNPPTLSRTLIEIGIHIFCVGLPAALVARKYFRPLQNS